VSAAPLLALEKASLGHDGKAVLSGVSLEVKAGQFWGVLGANGSGKTTILRTLLGLIPPLSGRVRARGERGDMPRFGYVPQKESLDAAFPLTGLDVAAMGTWRKLEPLRPWHGDDRAAFVRECLAECGASGFAGKPFSALSGGQKQRVLLARALAAEAEILMLDEPLSGLDLQSTHALLDLLAALKKRRGLTVLMVSHRLRAEKELFTHVAFVDDGAVQSGPAAEMLGRGRLAEILRGEL
jgi:ABC-type Mn2+/Zn2+ transport system ATPase subunit